MRIPALSLFCLLVLGASSCGSGTDDSVPQKIIAMERAALDRWGKGDPQGYLEIMAPEITYFDPSQEKRVDGDQAMRNLLMPITGKIKVNRYDMIGPNVQHRGDVAILTFNLVSYAVPPQGTQEVPVRWNSTEVYGLIAGQWRIVHSHWSYIKPELKQPLPE